MTISFCLNWNILISQIKLKKTQWFRKMGGGGSALYPVWAVNKYIHHRSKWPSCSFQDVQVYLLEAERPNWGKWCATYCPILTFVVSKLDYKKQ